MEIRRFYAENMEQGLEAVTAALGPDAVILDAVENNDQIEIFASTESIDEQAIAQGSNEDIEQDNEIIHTRSARTPGGGSTVPPTLIAAPSRARNVMADLIPEELQSELYLLRKSLRRELEQLTNYRQMREEQDTRPDPTTQRLQEDLDQLRESLDKELSGLGAYHQQRIQIDAELDPVTTKLQSNLNSLQENLSTELTTLVEYQQRREAADAELDPKRSQRWNDLGDLQTSLSGELSQLCEYRLQRAALDAESDPMTKSLQNELGDQQKALQDEISSLRKYQEHRTNFHNESDPRTRELQNGLSQLQQSLTTELEKLTTYHSHRIDMDAKSDPITRNLQKDLRELKTGLSDELSTLQEYRQQRIALDAECDPMTRSLHAGLAKLQSRMNEELERFEAYSARRIEIDAAADPKAEQMQSRLSTLQNSLADELTSLQEHRQNREDTQARLDPITTGLHTELTHLQASLRGELIQLDKQRQLRDNAEAETRTAFQEIQNQYGEMQGVLKEELEGLVVYRRELRAEHEELKVLLQNELAEFQTFRTQQVKDRADPIPERLHKEFDELQQSLKSELTYLSEYRLRNENSPKVVKESPPPTIPLATKRHSPGDLCRQKIRSLGLSGDVMRSLVKKLPQGMKDEHDWRKLLETLSLLFSVGDDEIIKEGGVVALIGSTGVGKTTTAAKLAAQYTLRHGPGKVALISTDALQPGGSGQLESFAQTLDIPLATASDSAELNKKILEFESYDLILIDTGGVNQRDLLLNEQLRSISDTDVKIINYLVVSATSELTFTDEVIESFRQLPLKGMIMTKTDEATTLGPAMSGVIRHQLPVTYICNGQDIQQNIAVADKTRLLTLSKKLVAQATLRRRAALQSSQRA